MKNLYHYCFLILLVLGVGCDTSSNAEEEHQITATIDGETWHFYNVLTNTTDDGDTRLVAKGYLMGDRGAEPANLEVVFVGVQDLASAGAGYTADFSPSSTGNSAYAILTLPQLSRTFDTKLDPATTGTFTITEIQDRTMSGQFEFKAKDHQGNLVTVESAEFKNVQLDEGGAQ